VFLAFLLRGAAARLFPWLNRSPKETTVVADVVVVAPPEPTRRRRAKRHSPLSQAKNSDPGSRMWCGPTTVSATIGVDIVEVNAVIRRYRNDGSPVRGTTANELQVALQHFGYDLRLAADFSANPLPPTFATWERAQIDMDACFIVEVTDHWTAYRGGWFVDSFTRGVPTRAREAPHRRKRVRRVYQVFKRTVA